MKSINRFTGMAGIALLLGACGGGDEAFNFPEATKYTFDVSNFSSNSAGLTSTYFPMTPGKSMIYEGDTDEGKERIEIYVSHETKTILGVESAIVVDRAYLNSKLVEETFDWYARDNNGDTWYMGEASHDYENGKIVTTKGSWEAGKDIANKGHIAKAGILIFDQPVVDSIYFQEYYENEATDSAQVIRLDANVKLSDGTSATALQTKEWNPLEPDGFEYKYYVAGTVLVLETDEDGEEPIRLISSADQKTPNIKASNFTNPTTIDNIYFPLIPGTKLTYEIDTDEGKELTVTEVLASTRNVMAINNVVVRDQVSLDGVIIDDTHDWFAQDNNGNVWYFGEEVDNYNYDDNGILINITHEGAWEAGVDGAQPGIFMMSNPRVGDSYRQEYYAGEAEDLAAVSERDVAITLSDGSQHQTLKIKEWDPLNPDTGFEYKYFALGIGMVREENETGDEQIDLIERVVP